MTLIRKPKQARSRATYERLLDGAQEVLAKKSFEAASIQEIAAAADLTIGAFYARFSNKEALLLGLAQRYDELIEQLLQRLEAFAGTSPSLSGLVHRLVLDASEVYRLHRGVLRPLGQTARVDPDLKEQLKSMNLEVMKRLIGYLSAGREEIRHRDPEVALPQALLMIFGTLRLGLVEDDLLPEDGGMKSPVLVDELTTAVVAYLGCGPRQPEFRTKGDDR